MGLDNLVEEIMQDAKAEAERIDDESKEGCSRIVNDAEEAAKQRLAKAEEGTKKAVEAEKDEKIAAARLQGKKLIEGAHEAAVNTALDEVWNRLVAKAKARDYGKLLGKLIERGAKELGKKDFVVMVNSGDRKAVKEMKYSLADGNAECEGGAVVMTYDEKVRVDMTFEALFAAKKEDLRKQIYTSLFGKRISEAPKLKAEKAEAKKPVKKATEKKAAKPLKKGKKK